MRGGRILWGQIAVVFAIAVVAIWAATQWTAWRLGFQPQLGHPWFELAGWPIYHPPVFFWWWFSYDAYAPAIFTEGAMIAASGGFIAPFIDTDLEWDFRVPRVVSIQASGHKYGMVYPGVGWVVWRHKRYLPEDLIFYVNYLGGEMPTFALNFSRPGSQVLLQYFLFLRLGFEGYRSIQQNCRDVAMHLSGAIEQTGAYRLITRGDELPVFAFALRDDVDKFTVFDVSNLLRQRGWLVPAYTFPKNREDLAVLRVVCRNGFSRDLADLFLEDLEHATTYLTGLSAPLPREQVTPGFSH